MGRYLVITLAIVFQVVSAEPIDADPTNFKKVISASSTVSLVGFFGVDIVRL